MPEPRSTKNSKRSAEKSLPLPSAIIRALRQKYEYTELAKVSLSASDSHNVYGIVIDAAFPHKVAEDKYVCSLKIVDPSLHSKPTQHKATDNDFATVVIYGKRFEDIPIVSKVGDIIRLHRATLRMYKNQRQFNVSTHWNGSWACFSTDDNSQFYPQTYSGKRATFEKHETALLTTLRKWAQSYFATQDGVTSDLYINLKQAKAAPRDFDCVVRILQVFDMDEYTNELKIADTTGDNWYVLALKLKFPDLQAGQVVRIRSATFDGTSLHKQMLNLQHFSNILQFVSTSRLVKTLHLKVADDWKADLSELKKAVPMHAIVLSEVD